MHASLAATTSAALPRPTAVAALPVDRSDPFVLDRQRIAGTLALVAAHVPVHRRLAHAGERVYSAGSRFESLYIVHAGFFKIINLASDGREQLAGLQFKGDWLGFDGISSGVYGCDAVAMDTGEVWAIRYEDLLVACAAQPALMASFHQAMSREMTRERDALLSLCTLPADARVANFVRAWAQALAQQGLRTDQVTLRMTRAEIGNYLGLTLETVSRALSRLARLGLISFAGKGRRELQIPDLVAISDFVDAAGVSAADTLQ
jgi:CRP/FNR family transcriptional regulator, anaerobic regulatory protein